MRACIEKMMNHRYKENGARNIYSDYNQMRAYVDCSPNQYKNYTLSTFLSSNRRNFEDSDKSAGDFCIGVLSEYFSPALPAHAYKMVTTTACVLQIDNCLCNR